MNCPKKIIVKPTEITESKCKENLKFWRSRLNDIDENAINFKLNSLNILPAHTSRYDYLKKIFGYDEKTDEFNLDCLGILSKKERLKVEKKANFNLGVPDQNMTTSVNLGHDIFVFAYHGVHNPYHRQMDPPPQQPIGYFIKKSTEVFSCVHATPCDVSVKNEEVDPFRIDDLDKFYLLPGDLREYKPLEIQKDRYLQNDFWFYYGSPEYWENIENYGANLYKRQGEFRYLGSIKPGDIEAILWPIWTSSISSPMDKNWDLISKFKKTFTSIKVIEYNLKSHGNRWAMALVEASYYSQKYFLLNNSFHNSASIAKKIVLDHEQQS